MPWLLPAARSVCSIHARVSLPQPLPDTAVHQDATCHFPPFLSAEAEGDAASVWGDPPRSCEVASQAQDPLMPQESPSSTHEHRVGESGGDGRRHRRLVLWSC